MKFWRGNKPPLVCLIQFFTKTNMVTITTIRLIPITASISVVRLLKIPKNSLPLFIHRVQLLTNKSGQPFILYRSVAHLQYAQLLSWKGIFSECRPFLTRLNCTSGQRLWAPSLHELCPIIFFHEVRRSNQSARSHPQTRLDLIQSTVRSYPQST